MIDLEPGDSHCHDAIGNGVGLREHVLDLLAGIDVPLRHIVSEHLCLFLFRQALALTDMFHDGKGIQRFKLIA